MSDNIYNSKTRFTGSEFNILIEDVFRGNFTFASGKDTFNAENSKFFGNRRCGKNEVQVYITGNTENYTIYVTEFTKVEDKEDPRYLDFLKYKSSLVTSIESKKSNPDNNVNTIKSITVNSKKGKDIWNTSNPLIPKVSNANKVPSRLIEPEDHRENTVFSINLEEIDKTIKTKENDILVLKELKSYQKEIDLLNAKKQSLLKEIEEIEKKENELRLRQKKLNISLVIN